MSRFMVQTFLLKKKNLDILGSLKDTIEPQLNVYINSMGTTLKYNTARIDVKIYL